MAQLGDTIIKGDLNVIGNINGNIGANLHAWKSNYGYVSITNNPDNITKYFKLFDMTHSGAVNNDYFFVFGFSFVREVTDTNKTFKIITSSVRSHSTDINITYPTFRVVCEDITNYRDNIIMTYKKINSTSLTISIYVKCDFNYSTFKLRLMEAMTRTSPDIFSLCNMYQYNSINSGIDSIPSNETIVNLS